MPNRGFARGFGFGRPKSWSARSAAGALSGSVLDIDFTTARALIELIQNGSFSDSSGWTLKAAPVGTETMTISGGTLNLTGDGTNQAYADQSFATVVGQSYTLTFTAAANGVGWNIGTTQGGTQILQQSGNGAFTVAFTATATTTWLRFFKGSAVLGTVDNVSVKPVAFAGVPLSVVNASGGYAQTSAGTWTNFAANTARITDKGLLVEEQRTNSIRNNSMQGVVAGTPGTAPTNWAVTPQGGLSSQIVGTGTENGIDYIDLRFFGTSGSTTDSFATFEPAGIIAALNAQTWTQTAFVRIVAGSLTNVNSIAHRLSTRDGASAQIAAYTGSDFKASLGASLTRTSYTLTITDAATAGLRPLFVVNHATGAVDITLRIGWPQLELGAFATSPIRTTTAAATRAADVVKFATVPWWNDAAGTLFTDYAIEIANPTSGSNSILASISASASATNNRIQLYLSAANRNLDARIVAGGVAANPVQPAPTITTPASGKAALAFAVGASQGILCSNGTLGTASSPAALPTAAAMNDGLTLGGQSSNIGTAVLNGYLKRVAYWNSRLANATLQSLTA